MSCSDDTGCPDGFACVANTCRSGGATGPCDNGPPGSSTLSQTGDETIDRNLVFACTNTDSTTAQSSWYRMFDLVASGVTTAFHVTSVSFGICFAENDPHVFVKLWSYGGGFFETMLDDSKLALLAMTDVAVPSTQITEHVTADITADVAPDTLLVVEVGTNTLAGTGQQVSIGSTHGTETRDAYIRTPSCGQAKPVTTTVAGLSRANFIISVTGTH